MSVRDLTRVTGAVLGIILLSATAAEAQLANAGPPDARTGFPEWYEDGTGLRLQPCIDESGFCSARAPDPTRRLEVPDNFPDAANYWSARAELQTANGGRARMEFTLGATFLSGAIAQGEQVTLLRMTLQAENLIEGQLYTITHPFGTTSLVAGPSGAMSVDQLLELGCGSAPCDFDSVLNGPIGPFLVWDPAVPPAAPAGYIGDPGTPHAVVGSPFGTNLFRIDGLDVGGPGVSRIETQEFLVEGKRYVPPVIAVGPLLSASPSAISFGGLPVGDGETRLLVVANEGDEELEVGGLFVAGANASEFAVVQDLCTGERLDTGENCELLVLFAPTTAGELSAELTVSSNSPGGASVIPLTGRGLQPAIAEAQPVSLTFPDTDIRSTATLPLVVTNTGETPLGLFDFTLGGVDARSFSIATNPCRLATIQPGGSCTLSINFHPTEAGPRTAVLSVRTDAPAGNLVVPLSGVGTAVPPLFVTSTASLSFPTTIINTTSTRTFALRNDGGSPVVVQQLAVSGADATSFSHGSGCLGIRLLPGFTCTVTMNFRPTRSGALSAAVTVSGPGAASVSVALSGTAIVDGGILQTTPSTLTFPNTFVGQSSSLTTVLRNVGNRSLRVNSITLGGPDAAHFTISSNSCVGTYSVGANCTLRINFRPTAPGPRTAVLVLNNTAPAGVVRVPLSGTALRADIVASPNPLAFGGTAPNVARFETVTVTNTGTTSAQIGTISITGPQAGNFVITSNGCGSRTIAAGAQCSMIVRFRSSSIGSKNATMTIPSNRGTESVPLSGVILLVR